MNIKSIILFLLLLIPFLGSTQKNTYEKGLLFYEKGQYNRALEYFYADKFASENKDLLIRRIISNYETGKLDNAKKDVAKLLAFENYSPKIFLYIAKIYHAEGNYNKAVENYKSYLRLNAKAKDKKEVIHLIKQCGQARKLKYIEAEAFVDNYGNTINTEFDEFRMIQSPNYDTKYYFSSARTGSNGGKRNEKGKRDDTFGFYNSDMYTVEMYDGEWLPIRALNPFINTSRDELALDFSSDGSILFYMKGESYESGTIYTDTFSVDKKEVLEPAPLKTPIDASIGDTWLNLFNDKTILFSSKRPGGYGGYDLYVTYNENGEWSKPKNLGPTINSKYDEISPCISIDGNVLYFSSNRVESFGGYDIFKTNFNVKAGIWEEAKNVGNPINSAGNDIGFYLSKDGNNAFLSSDRKEGFGGYDLYIAYFNNQVNGQLNSSSKLAFIENDEFVPYVTSTPIDQKNTGSKAASPEKKKLKKDVNDQNVAVSQKTSVKKEAKVIDTPKNKENTKAKKVKKDKPLVQKTPPEKEVKVIDIPEKNEPTETKKVKKETLVIDVPVQQETTPEKEIKFVEPTKNKKAKKKKASTKSKKTKKQKRATVKETIPNKKITEYILNPVFYDNNKEIINPESRKELDIVVRIMKQYPQIKLHLKAHTIEDGMEAVDLYFTIKRAEQIGKFLAENGIDKSRIYLKGYGSNYPIAKVESGGKPNKIAEKVNSRIEFEFKNIDNLPIKIDVIQPYLVEYLRDSRGEIFNTVEDGLSYRVQVANVGQMYQNQILLLYNDGMIERGLEETNYRYTLGLYESYIDAQDLVKDLKNYDVTGAFIVPYIDGVRIDKKDYKFYTKKYEDFLNYTQNQK